MTQQTIDAILEAPRDKLAGFLQDVEKLVHRSYTYVVRDNAGGMLLAFCLCSICKRESAGKPVDPRPFMGGERVQVEWPTPDRIGHWHGCPVPPLQVFLENHQGVVNPSPPLTTQERTDTQ